jgi:hypothetical protein
VISVRRFPIVNGAPISVATHYVPLLYVNLRHCHHEERRRKKKNVDSMFVVVLTPRAVSDQLHTSADVYTGTDTVSNAVAMRSGLLPRVVWRAR